MSVKVFLDTNIFVYSFDETDSSKRKKSKEIIFHALKDQRGYISYQVVQEFINVATKKFTVQIKQEDLSEYLDAVLMPLCVVYPSHELYKHALEINHRYKLSFYDALIVASAAACGCKQLLSEDFGHNQTIAGLKIQNPYL